MSDTRQLEVWQRGPIEGIPPLLMPVAHALIQASEDIDRLAATVPAGFVWSRPGGAASIGFHVRHLGGALDRLFTYARGESLSATQKDAARAEAAPGDPPPSLELVVTDTKAVIDRAMDQLRKTPTETLLEDRKVGRAGLPSNVLGLLFHAAEHCTRHVGQAITTAKILGH
jgi:hypothetical protein